MTRFIMSIINNDRSLYYIILFFLAVAVVFSGFYCFALPLLEGSPALIHIFQPDRPITYLDCFYFSATTQTTVGYGDIVAFSKLAKIISLFQCIFGYFYLAFSAAIFACKGIMKSKKFEILLHGYRRDLEGASEYNN